MLSPSCTQKVGSQVTNPKIKVFITIRVVAPTIMRGNSAGLSREPRLAEGGAEERGTGGTREPRCCETSLSIDCRRASASAVRPTASSQRGDSGNALRRYQTTSAPSPPSANIGRHPKGGMISGPRSAATGKPDTTMTFMPPSQLPRAPEGTNSVIVEDPTTFSASSPHPMTNRNRVSTVIEGEKAEAMAASPKIARLA